MTQKKILLKSMKALEFQCPLKFRCQTRDIIHKGLLDIKGIETRGVKYSQKRLLYSLFNG